MPIELNNYSLYYTVICGKIKKNNSKLVIIEPLDVANFQISFDS